MREFDEISCLCGMIIYYSNKYPYRGSVDSESYTLEIETIYSGFRSRSRRDIIE